MSEPKKAPFKGAREIKVEATLDAAATAFGTIRENIVAPPEGQPQTKARALVAYVLIKHHKIAGEHVENDLNMSPKELREAQEGVPDLRQHDTAVDQFLKRFEPQEETPAQPTASPTLLERPLPDQIKISEIKTAPVEMAKKEFPLRQFEPRGKNPVPISASLEKKRQSKAEVQDAYEAITTAIKENLGIDPAPLEASKHAEISDARAILSYLVYKKTAAASPLMERVSGVKRHTILSQINRAMDRISDQDRKFMRKLNAVRKSANVELFGVEFPNETEELPKAAEPVTLNNGELPQNVLRVIGALMEATNYSLDDLRGESRHKSVSNARITCAYFIEKLTGAKDEAIATLLSRHELTIRSYLRTARISLKYEESSLKRMIRIVGEKLEANPGSINSDNGPA